MRMATQMGRARAVALVGAIAACSSQQGPRPELPGEGAGAEPDPAEPEAEDPWADRELIEPPEPPTPSAVPLPEIETLTLSNGLEVMVIEDRDIPVAEVRLALRAGEREVPAGKAGLARFAANMLTKGTEERDALAIAEAIDFVGGSLSARAGHEATWVSCEVLSKDLQTCLELVPEVLTEPAFPEDEMPQVARNLRSEIRSRRDNAGQLAGQHIQNAIWGGDHVRGWILSEKSLAALGREDLVDWHEQWFAPQNATLAVAGDVDADALADSLEEAFGRWPQSEVPERPQYEEPDVEGVRVRLVDKPDQSQAHIRLGHLGISRHDDDFFPVKVANYALGGGGFSSRLMRVLRAQEGKTYGASSSFDQNADRGSFIASTFTRVPQTVETAKLLLEEIRKLAGEGPTEAEVNSAIGNLAAQYAMRFETVGDVASALLSARVRGLDVEDVRDYPLSIGDVSVSSAREAAARRLDPDNLRLVIVGPAKDIAPQLESAGLSYEVVDHQAPVAGYERSAVEGEPSGSGEPESVDPEAAAEAEEILDRALAAKGGYEELSEVESIAIEGEAEMEMGPQKMPANLSRSLVRPDKLRVDLDIGGGMAEVTTAYDGERGWMRQVAQGQEQIVDLPDSELRAVKAELWRDPELVLLRYREEGTIAEALGEEEIEGAPHYTVRLRSPEGHEVRLYIDQAEHRLRRMSYQNAEGGQATMTLSDYREIEGIEVAHERKTEAPQQSLHLEIDRVTFNRAIDSGRFERP